MLCSMFRSILSITVKSSGQSSNMQNLCHDNFQIRYRLNHTPLIQIDTMTTNRRWRTLDKFYFNYFQLLNGFSDFLSISTIGSFRNFLLDLIIL